MLQRESYLGDCPRERREGAGVARMHRYQGGSRGFDCNKMEGVKERKKERKQETLWQTSNLWNVCPTRLTKDHEGGGRMQLVLQGLW